MGGLGIWHWIIVGIAILLLFGGRGKISEMMGDMAKGIKAFKKGMSDEDTASTEPKRDPKSIDHQPSSPPVRTETEKKVG